MLAAVCVGLIFFAWRMRTQNALLALELQRLREQTSILQKQLEEALLKITEQEKLDSTTDGLLERVVQGFVVLGIPGLVLLVAVATSGFAGAAALTTALAALEDRKHGLPRVDHLRQAPAKVRFLSIEPLLEDLGEIDLSGIAWVIVGRESGPGARPMKREWVISIRKQ